MRFTGIRHLVLGSGLWALSLFIFTILISGCISNTSQSIKENPGIYLKLTKIGSSDYLTIELKGNEITVTSLPSPMAGIAPEVRKKTLTAQEVAELLKYIKNVNFMAWGNETGNAFEVTMIEIQTSEGKNAVSVEIGKESKKFNELADKILILSNP